MESARKATNLSLDAALLAEARALGVNLSRAAEDGLSRAVQSLKEEAWKRENAKAISAANDWVEENGLPLAHHRMF
ncbi:type II toxin-antitoxin system CcdA family antitoxin [Vannielia litorea]|uniref:type II toxin-antitoxin system CcdA family antitoxin n=1 Tax=Vannielia TaxID=2813041 RepID=UPI001C9853BA|nr:type II toxin-antitoxin system CcdA family antitoxin [Vannielia litorea]MBY6046100.1 type II toxin-antitoxin system CcdA family antitoxin [Vannielia litorea]MBY6073513.1 type II toxin-antitoxin system CcdA family antitoxin [Vannielia litorea]MBY6154041.1 type II toxin-antitoxin system CcdA family antitoxin [Vannielia litorea]